MKRFFLLLIIPLFCVSLSAQINKYGVPVMKNYSTQVTTGTEVNWWITKDNSGAVYFGNDDKGVIRYDGSNWSNIPVRNNSRVRSLGSDKNGIIYVGCAFEFGFIEPDKDGKLGYVSLSARYDKPAGGGNTPNEKTEPDSGGNVPEITIGEIQSLIVNDTSVFYLSRENMFIYNINNQDLKIINLRDLGFWQLIRIYNIYDRIILADNIKGLFEYKDGKVESLPGGEKFSGMRCLTVLPAGDGKVVVGTYDDGVFLYDVNTGVVDGNWVEPAVNARLTPVYCGVRLPSGEFAIGTVGGEDGIFIIDRNGKVLGIWNTSTTDLKDNLIYALYSETSNNELWITTAGYITKAYTNLPYTQFSEISGISAGINGLCELNGIIYAASDVGVYKSQKDKNGSIRFVDVEGINDQVFPLFKASVDGREFILAGCITGVYQIYSDGRTLLIKDKMKFTKEAQKSALPSRYFTQSRLDPHRFYFGTSSEGVIVVEYRNGQWRHISSIKRLKGQVSFQHELDNGDLFVMTDYPNALYKIMLNDSIPVQIGTDKGLPATSLTCISKVGEEVVITTGKGIYKYNEENDSWSPFNDVTGGYSAGKDMNFLYEDDDKDLWLEFNDNRYYSVMFSKTDSQIVSFKKPMLAMPNVKMLDIRSMDGRVWLAKSKFLFAVDKKRLSDPFPKPRTLLTRIALGDDSVLMNGTFFRQLENGRRLPEPTYQGSSIPEIKYNLNSISFFWATPCYMEEEVIQYSYLLEGFSDQWSKWENIDYKDFTNLSFGKYKFRVKAKTINEVESVEAVYDFIILKPWYLTTPMIFLYAIVLVLVIFAIISAYTRKLKNENIRLEGIVAERTAVVVKQKEELESSIHYASRIQMALLPSEAILSENLKNYFILFKPRDIVSGDFYWMTKKENRLYIVAADCTGHGVPGAFMSLLGMSFLDEIIDKEHSVRADHILRALRLHVTESLKQSGGDDEAKDGMDMALLVIDFNFSKIEFSGAYNPCFRVRKLTEDEAKNFKDENIEMADGSMSNGKHILETIYASKMPIGISRKMDENFVFYDWNLEKGVSYYLFSDGYIDQFGGQHGRKFMKKTFKRLLLEIQDYPMKKQKELLDQNLRDWMGQSPQIDDILVMGIRTD